MKPGVVLSGFPIRIGREVYDEAIARYVASVGDRCDAIYQVGNVAYPGLSDIDLVVVVSRPSWDNNQYFSPFVRLANPYRSLFHHQPRYIPSTCLDAIEYSSCVHASVHARPADSTRFGSCRRLLFGSDAIGELAVDVTSFAWQRCRVLEIAFLLRRTSRELSSPTHVNVTKLVSRATALRYPMRHLHDLLGIRRDADYDDAIDAYRTELLDAQTSPAQKHGAARAAAELLEGAIQRFETGVRTLFGLRSDEDVSKSAAEMLAGLRPANGIDSTYLTARRTTMDRYHRELFAFRLTDGSIFATKPYNGTIKAYPQPFAHRVASGARWRWHDARIGSSRNLVTVRHKA